MPRLARVLSVLSVMSLSACPKDPVSPGSAGGSGTGDATTGAASSGGAAPPTTSASGTSTGSSGGSSSGGAGTSSGGGSSSSGGVTDTDPVVGTSTGTSGTGGDTSTGEHTTGDPPVLVDCFDCTCDINTTFCRKVFAGALPFAGPEPPMCPVVEADSLDSGCVPYPPRCGDAPTCECLPTMNDSCFCTEVRPGAFQVVCPLP